MSRLPLRILLIAEDPNIRERLVARVVDDGGVDALVFRVANVEGALERLEGRQADVVIVALDDGSCRASVGRINARFDELPILALVGDATPDFCRGLMRDGAIDAIPREVLDDDPHGVLCRGVRYADDRARLALRLAQSRDLAMHLAHNDTLTDLPNRQEFRRRLRQHILRAKRHPQSLAVLFLDLDRFKQINETLGHGTGDRILQLVAKRLSTCVRETDLAARRGGDEFTMILDGIRRGQDAARVARKILAEVSKKPYVVDGHELFVGVSIGISMFPTDGRDVDTLVKHADIAMYRAKARGGGSYQFYLPDMNDRAIERMEMEHSLRQAIERDQFVLHYQPQVDLGTGRIVAMEALVRWEHPDLGIVRPDEFIPLAEETGLIVQLGEWVLVEACRQAQSWVDAGLDDIVVAVNWSARQFQHERPVERVRAALQETGLSPHHLELELTESAVMKDKSFAVDTLRQLRDLGVSIAIDDFGTGHSSLAYLKSFPITKLKIDKTFIRTMLVDPKDAALTRGIISMAHSLGLAAVAEGVETRQQFEFLKAPRCDQLQGYLFGRPQPAEEAGRLLATGITT